MTKIVALADIHGTLPEIPPTDLLLIAGDICPYGDHSLTFQESWLDSAFKYWLNNVPAKKTIFIFGNHDFIGEHPHRLNKILPKLKATYLEDDYCYYENIKIYGSPWQLYHGGWAFNLYESDLKEKWKSIPDDIDILLTHSPPTGFGDLAPRKSKDDTIWPEPEHVGSPSLLERLNAIQPKLHIFGHIHVGYGQYQLGNTLLINAALSWPTPRLPFVINLDEKATVVPSEA